MAAAEVTYADVKLPKSRAKGETEDASCCLQITQTSTEIYSSWFTEVFVFKDETFPKCEAEWEPHGGSCYYFSTNKSSWTDSRRSCQHHGSDLVKIDSREEQLFLWKKLRRFIYPMKMNGTKNFWIGLTDSKEEGKWFWVDGSPLNKSLSFWSEDQPGNKHGGNKTAKDRDCVRMERKTKEEELIYWFHASCDDPLRSICEKAANVSQCFCH
uniref:C-type lectin domain-containing protein n=1 Tax=Xiphophorus couchianus TaxID=32473 RepID=A0A3B5M392_9TELE